MCNHFTFSRSGLLGIILCLAGSLTPQIACRLQADEPSKEPSSNASRQNELDLAGDWTVRLDAQDHGIREKWFLANFTDHLHLPGSLDAQGIGNKTTRRDLAHLTKTSEYVGPAWYRKRVNISSAWAGQRITLFLERCHWETQVWVDGEYAGLQNSLSAPHVYDLSTWLTPGEHDLTIRVDNTLKINVCHSVAGSCTWAHSVTDETQTNWNGVIGRMTLTASAPIWIDAMQVYPEPNKNNANVRLVLGNATGSQVQGRMSLATAPDVGAVADYSFAANPGKTTVEVPLPLSKDCRLWDEFDPALYRISAAVSGEVNGKAYRDQRSIETGFRDFHAVGKQLLLNGRPVFLRGNLECCIFPLTGYPAMDTDGWLRILKIAKSYGLNHLRFHSWCPPEAAFAAADQLGVMFQIEAPVWDGYGWLGDNAASAAWILEEVNRIVDVYGNHPSFCLMSMGNEWGDGKSYYLRYLVEQLRRKDARHCYTCTTHPADLARNDDYFSAAGTDLGITRGMSALEDRRPSTLHDFGAAMAPVDRPFISHEVGQPCTYPNYDEIKKYTGHLRPYNLETFRDSLAAHHMLDQAPAFAHASGLLAAAIYKENIESLLRTPEMDGFQLLGIQDFPGQGTALVGILDAFWDSKGLIAPEKFRQFCGPTVPLLRMKNFVWTDAETWVGQAEVAHFGPKNLPGAQPSWSIVDQRGKTVAQGKLPVVDIPTGGNTKLGEIKFDLATVAAPAKLSVQVALDGTEFVNSWNIWVYPADKSVAVAPDVLIANQWNQECIDALQSGRKVLLMPYLEDLVHAVPMQWSPVFWCTQLFSGQKQTMGILCDPAHPALAKFPTESFGDWQWYDLLEHAMALNMDETPADYRPIVQPIHDFNFNSKLGCLFEARVGRGSLLVSMMDLVTDLEHRPEARQMRRSLIEYMQSDKFKPTWQPNIDALNSLLAKRRNDSVVDGPESSKDACLHVFAAANVAAGKSQDWSPEADRVVARADDFGYRIQGGTWKDAGGSAWHNTRLIVEVSCPRGFEGTLYIHLHDWGSEGRRASMFFQGADLGPLTRYDGKGVWLKLPVKKGQADDGKLVFEARSTSGPNVMATQLILLPKSDR